MPKRIVDGDGLWRSDKLAQVQPVSMKAEYANLIPLALSNGSFEATPRRVWAAVYAYNRLEITVEQVEQILLELERVKLLFRWTDNATGKVWGYWIGIDKPGRLPGRSRRGRNEAVGQEPPADELRKFLDSNGIREVLNGNEKLLGSGLGSGSGFGSGINPSSAQKACSDKKIAFPKKPEKPSQEARRLAALLKAEILRNKSDCRITEAQLRKWEIIADRMLKLDNRSAHEIEVLIRWVQNDNFWMSNVLSMDTLRDKFDQLQLKAGKANPSTLSDSYMPASERIRRERMDGAR